MNAGEGNCDDGATARTSSSPPRRSGTGRVIVRLLGGMGNQLFQYAAGRALAEASGRVLVFDTALLDQDRLRAYSLEAWGVQVPRGVPRLAPSVVLRMPGLWRALRHTGGRVMIGDTLCLFDRMGGEPLEANRPEVASAREARDVVLTGYWQQRDYFAPIEEALRRALRPIRRMQFDADALALGADAGAIAVHVRRGDYTSAASSPMHPVVPLSYQQEAIRRIGAERPELREALVFTDDPEWAAAQVTLPIATRVVSTPGGAPERDLWIMSRCGAVVMANSSFSWWAAWLAEAHGALIVAPNPWFGPVGATFKHPAPEAWERVGWGKGEE